MRSSSRAFFAENSLGDQIGNRAARRILRAFTDFCPLGGSLFAFKTVKKPIPHFWLERGKFDMFVFLPERMRDDKP